MSGLISVSGDDFKFRRQDKSWQFTDPHGRQIYGHENCIITEYTNIRITLQNLRQPQRNDICVDERRRAHVDIELSPEETRQLSVIDKALLGRIYQQRHRLCPMISKVDWVGLVRKSRGNSIHLEVPTKWDPKTKQRTYRLDWNGLGGKKIKELTIQLDKVIISNCKLISRWSLCDLVAEETIPVSKL